MALALAAGPLTMGSPAAAQAPGPDVALPKRPVPYSRLAPKPKPKLPATTASTKPAAAPASSTTKASTGAAATPHPPVAPGAATPPSHTPAHPAAATPHAAGPTPHPAAVTPHPAALPVAPQGPGLPPAALEAFVDGWMAEAMARTHTPGAAVAIVQNGQVVLKKGYGFADLDPRRAVDPDTTLFRLGSLSQTFTWVLLMKEVEAGRIRLDRPINLYLPEKVRLPGRGRNVMVGQLLDHSAGFEERALGRLEEDNLRRVRPLELYLRENRPSVVRAPGLLSSYASYDSALAGEAVGFVAGQTFERRAEDQVFQPLGMAHTTFREPRDDRRGLPAAMPAALRADLARGYGWRDVGFMADSYEYVGQVAPALGASSTAADMARYMRMLLADGRTETGALFGPLAAKAFRSPMRLTPAGINGWAHGFMNIALPGSRPGYGHSGDAIAFQSNMVLAPDLGLGVFVVTNSERGRAVADGLPAALVRHFYAPAAVYPRLGSPQLVGQGPVYDGHYLSTRRAYGGLEGFVGLLQHGADVRVTPGGRLIVARLRHRDAWTLEAAAQAESAAVRFVSTTGDDHLAFHVRSGQAWGFQPSNGAELFERAPLWERPSTFLTLGVLAALAALATLMGSAFRSRRELRQNAVQARAGLVQNIQAGLWLTAFGLFAAWWRASADAQALMYGWPGPLIVTASACALVAAGLSLVTIAALPAVWQGGRRVDSWTVSRKAFFTLTVLIYATLSVVLAMGGALEPWSG